MKSIAFISSSIESLENDLQTKIEESEFTPSLAMVFSSIKHDLLRIGPMFSDHNIQLAGCSTAGEICNDQFVDESIVTILMDMNPAYFEVFTGENSDNRSTYQIAFDLGQRAVELFENPAVIVLSGGMQVIAENILKGVQDATGRNFPFFGGLAGDDAEWTCTFVFDNEIVTDFGLVALILDNDKLEVKGMATSGWEPIGLENVITEAEGNVVYTINNEPALDVFIRYFGRLDNTMVKGEDIPTMSAQYPLQIIRDKGEAVLRSPIIGNDEERSLTLAGFVKKGERFRFSISPGLDVIEKTIDNFEGFKQQQAEEADLLILFSCKGRHAAFGPMMEEEVAGIHRHWKNTPMVGFLSYGEIGNTQGGDFEFHNETCSLVAIKEK